MQTTDNRHMEETFDPVGNPDGELGNSCGTCALEFLGKLHRLIPMVANSTRALVFGY